MGTMPGPVKTRKGTEGGDTVGRGRADSLKVPGLKARVEQLLQRHGTGGKALTSEQLAQITGVPLSTVKQARYEGKISTRDAMCFARTLEVSLDWLLLDLGSVPERTIDGPGMPGAGLFRDRRVPDHPAPLGLAEGELRKMAQQVAELVMSALGRVVDKHEVIGIDLHKVLMRMAAGLGGLGHHEAAGEIYSLLVRLNQLELRAKKPPPDGS